MQVEDHPVDYAKFEGVIPEGEYGGGTVMVWDYGTYQPVETTNPGEAIRKGELKFSLNGKKLQGSWVLVRTRDRQWLLIKHRDYYTTEEEVTELAPVSILTRRSLAEIAEDEGGNIKKAATGDPKKIPPRTGVKRRKKTARKRCGTATDDLCRSVSRWAARVDATMGRPRRDAPTGLLSEESFVI